MIICVHDANAILDRGLRNRKEDEISRVYEEVNEYLQLRGYKPNFQRLDNEISENTKRILTKLQIKHDIFPPKNIE